MKEIRFTVGQKDSHISSIWKLWINKSDIYLIDRTTKQNNKHDKFSFHSSGICRWASIHPRQDGQDRAILKWKSRDFLLEDVSGTFLIFSLIVPSGTLSKVNEESFSIPNKIIYITDGPIGTAIKISVLLTDPLVYKPLLAKYQTKNFLLKAMLTSGWLCSVVAERVYVDKVDLLIPGKPYLHGQITHHDLRFTAKIGNHRNPFRITISNQIPVFWNIGGDTA